MPVLLDTGAVELLRWRDRRVETLAIQHYPLLVCRHIVGEFLPRPAPGGGKQAIRSLVAGAGDCYLTGWAAFHSTITILSTG